MSSLDSEVVEDASWILCNYASTEYTAKVWEHGGFNAFISAMQCHPTTSRVIDSCLWGIGNLASECFDFRVEILKSGFLATCNGIVDAKEDYDTGVLQSLGFCMTTLPICRFTANEIIPQEFAPPMFDVIKKIVENPNIKRTLRLYALRTIRSLSCMYPGMVISEGFLNYLIALIQGDVEEANCVLDIVRNITQLSETECLALVNANLLNNLHYCILSSNEKLRGHAAFILSNLMIEPNILPHIMSNSLVDEIWRLVGDNSYQVMKEASFVYFNLAHRGTNDEILQLLPEPVFRDIKKAFHVNDTNISMNYTAFLNRAIKAERKHISFGDWD